MLDSLNEVFVSMSPKEQPALVLSGVINNESRRSKIFVNSEPNPDGNYAYV
jgi:hypothetical protein